MSLLSSAKANEINDDFKLSEIEDDTKFNEILQFAFLMMEDHFTTGFDEVRKRILEKFNVHLSNVDCFVIDKECVKYALREWHKKVIKYVDDYLNERPEEKVLRLIKEFTDVTTLNNVLPEFKQLKFFDFILANRNFLNPFDEERVVNELGFYIYSMIKKFNATAMREYHLIMSIEYLFHNDFDGSIELIRKLKDKEELTMRSILEVVKNFNNQTLKSLANELWARETFHLEGQVVSKFKNLLQQPQTKTLDLDGRTLIEISGKFVIFSEKKDEIESLLKTNEKIEEVRIVGCHFFCVDSSLTQDLWHGKNIVVYARRIKLLEHVTWNVSGKDTIWNNEVAETLADGNGADGKDGQAGECGGNILIICDKIEDSSKWTLISNGGNGADGQDGGNGRDGNDSVPMSWQELDNLSISDGLNVYQDNQNRLVTLIRDSGFTWYEYIKLGEASEYGFGGRGGKRGYFGDGGFKGHIEIIANRNEISVSQLDGKNGRNGDFGYIGYDGNDANDVARYYRENFWTWSQVTYAYTDSVKLRVNYGSTGGNVVHCSKGPAEVEFDRYAVTRKYGSKRRDYYGNSGEKSTHSKAQGKKSVNSGNIKSQYNDLLESDLLNVDKPNIVGDDELQRLKQINDRKIEEQNLHKIKLKKIFEHDMKKKFKDFTTDPKLVDENLRPLLDDDFFEKLKEFESHHDGIKKLRQSKMSNDNIDIVANELKKFENLNGLMDTRYDSSKYTQFMITIIKMFLQTQTSDDAVQLIKNLDNADSEYQRLYRAVAVELEKPGNKVLLPLFEMSLKCPELLNEFQSKLQDQSLKSAYDNFKNFDVDKKHIECLQNIAFANMAQDLNEFLYCNTPAVTMDLFMNTKMQTFVYKIIMEKKKFNLLLEVYQKVSVKNLAAAAGNLPKFLERSKAVDGKFKNLIGKFIGNDSSDREYFKTNVEKLLTEYNQCRVKAFNYEVKAYVEGKHLVVTNTNRGAENTNETGEQPVVKTRQPNGLKYLNEIQNIANDLKSRGEAVIIDKLLKILLGNDAMEIDVSVDEHLSSIHTVERDHNLLKSTIISFVFNYNVDDMEDVKAAMEKFKELNQNVVEMDDENWYKSTSVVGSMELVERLFNSKGLQSKFIEFVGSAGVESFTYVNLFAALHNVNIKIFHTNWFNEFVEVEDFNSNANESIYFYQKDNGDYENLTVIEYYKDICVKSAQSQWFGSILNEMKVLNDLDSVDDYIRNEHFLQFKEDRNSNIPQGIYSPPDALLISIILEFFENSPKIKELSTRLHLISSSIIGTSEVLEAIAVCLHNDNLWIRADELIVCIDLLQILDDNAMNHEWRSLFALIFLTFPQDCWLIELIVLRIEDVARKTVDKYHFRQCLKSVTPSILILFAQKLMITMEKVEEDKLNSIVQFLQHFSIKSFKQFLQLDIKLWPYAGVSEFFKFELKKMQHLIGDTYDLLFNFLLKIQTIYGTDKSVRLTSMLTEKYKNASEDDLDHIESFKALENFTTGNWHLSDESMKLLVDNKPADWAKILNDCFASHSHDKSIDEIVKFFEHSTDGKSADFNDRLEQVKVIITSIFTDAVMDQASVVIPQQISNLRDVLMYITKGIMIATDNKIKLRHTQLFSLVIMLENQRDVILQIATGEGKSWIAVAFAIAKWMLFKQKVDIITSNKVLSERDATKPEFIKVFNMFNMNVGHNCSDDLEQRKHVYGSCHVIYGDLANFQRDYLLETFYGKNIFSGRQLQCVLIDEVDSMLLDKGNNILYLSHELPYMEDLKSIYIFIWQFITQKVQNEEQMKYLLGIENVRKAVFKEFFNKIEREDLNEWFNVTTVNSIWHNLIRLNIIDNRGFLLKSEIPEYNFKFFLNDIQFERLKFIIGRFVNRKPELSLPAYLQDFVLQHIDKWIENAVCALHLTNGKEYVVDVDRNGGEEHPVIIIQDLDTGSDLHNSEFDEGLCQFLQIKHGCQLTPQSLKAVFISNVSYFKQYQRLYGITGTLGSANERDNLGEVHGTEFIIIPQFKTKMFSESEATLCKNETQWLDKVCEESNVVSKQRSVLVICETIYDARKITAELKKRGFDQNKIIKYERSYDNPKISDLPTGKVIIATNIAGRGTDIIISDELATAGGLHVIVSFLPSNIRIEQQAFGRCARGGQPGTGKLIINCALYDNIDNLYHLKQVRDEIEIKRIESVNVYYKNVIKSEETLFQAFSDVFRNSFHSEITNDNEFKEILRKSFFDSWSFWLDWRSADVSNESLSDLLNSFKKIENDFKQLNHQNILKWIDDSHIAPSTIVQSSKYLDSPSVFQKLIDEYPDNLEVVYGQCIREFRSLDSFHLKDDKNDLLLKALTAFETSTNSEYFCFSVLKNFHDRNENDGASVNKALKEQHDNIDNVLNVFIKSLNDIRGTPIYPETLSSVFNDNDIIGEEVYYDLLRKGALTQPTISYREFMLPSCTELADSFGLNPDDLLKCLRDKNGTSYNNIEEIEKTLQENLKLPTAEFFWDYLKEGGKLLDEETIVYVDTKRLQMYSECLCEKLKAKKSDVAESIKRKPKCVFLYPHKNSQDETENPELEFLLQDLKNSLNEIKTECDVNVNDLFEELDAKKILTRNRFATFSDASIELHDFKSITDDDLNRLSIPVGDLKSIVETLGKKEVLKKSGDMYEMNVDKFNYFINNISDERLLDDLSMYESHIVRLLQMCFSYTLAITKISNNITSADKSSEISVPIASHTYRKLMNDLLSLHAIEPSRVNGDKYNDIGNIIEELYSHFKGTPSVIRDIADWFEGAFETIEHVIVDEPPYVDYVKSREQLIHDKRDELEKTLQSFASLLAKFETPEFKLKPLQDYLKDKKITAEANAFIIRGLDSIITFDEEKWTWKVIFRFIVVVIVAVVQFVVGTVILVASCGAMYQIGNALISEGISDAFFAASVIKTGFFTWKDYLKHKMISIAFTAMTTVVCAGFSAPMTTSLLGSKVIGPAVERGGQELAKLSGLALIKEVGVKEAAQVAFKQMVSQGLKVGSQALIQYGTDALLGTIVKDFGEKFAMEVNKEAVQKHFNDPVFNGKLRSFYQKFGKSGSIERIIKIIEETIHNNSYERLDKLLSNIVDFRDRVKDILNKGNYKATGIAAVLNTTKVIYSLTAFKQVVSFVYEMMNTMEEKIVEKLSEEGSQSDHLDEQEFQKFRSAMIILTQNQVTQYTSNILYEKITSPLLNYLALKFSDGVFNAGSKFVQKNWNTFKERRIRSKVNEIIELENERKLKLTNVNSEKELSDNLHQETLVKLMAKSRSPETIALLVRQNAYMNEVCFKAADKVLNNVALSEKFGGPYQMTIVNGDYSITIGPQTGKPIKLILDNFHFENEETGVKLNKNDCFYHALCDKIPGLKEKLDADTFRSRIADVIATDYDIGYAIRQGWHEYSTRINFYGGGKQSKSKKFPDADAKAGSSKQNIFGLKPSEIIEYKDTYRSKVLDHNNKPAYEFSEERDYSVERDLKLMRTNKSDFHFDAVNQPGEAGEVYRENCGRKLAIEKAIEAINKDIQGRDEKGKKVKTVTIDDFETTQYARIGYDDVDHENKPGMFNENGHMPVEMKYTYKDKNIIYTIDIDNPGQAGTAAGPERPHVGYDIHQEGQKSIAGHIFFPGRENSHPTRTKENKIDKLETGYVYLKPKDLLNPEYFRKEFVRSTYTDYNEVVDLIGHEAFHQYNG